MIEEKIYSQNGEDGILKYIFHRLGTTNKYFVEIGTESGIECNTRNLRENLGFTGLMIDGSHENADINLHKHWVNVENINGILKGHCVPHVFDLLSLDIDFNDWHVLREILNRFQPTVIVVECNSKWGYEADKVVKYDAAKSWDGSDYFGASVAAFNNLCKSFGYTLVYMDETGTNLFFVLDYRADIFKNSRELKDIFRTPKYGDGGHPADPHNRDFAKSVELLK